MLLKIIQTALLYLVLSALLGEGSKLNVSELRVKRSENAWSWGYEESDSTSKPPIAQQRNTKSPINTVTESVDYCKPLNPQVPDFSAPGRRISQVKCYEYIWNIKVLDDEVDRKQRCAVQKLTESGLIHTAAIGGRNTLPGEFPHMGAIGWKAVAGAWVFKCGGSLISTKFVLTAAHCTKASPRDTDISDVVPKIVRLGDKNILDTNKKSMKVIDANIMQIIIHPRYKSPAKYFDIALMELDRDVQFSDLVHPACLWGHMDTTSLGTQATLTGWGVVDTVRQKTSPELQAAVVDIIDTPLCNRLLMPWFNRNFNGLQGQICGGKLSGGVDACQGDSGGPLQVKINLPSNTRGSIHYIVGVISSGIGCGRPNIPGIYTKVSSYIDWIENVVWK